MFRRTPTRQHRRVVRVRLGATALLVSALCAAAIFLVATAAASAQPLTGWTRIPLPSGSYTLRYLPAGVELPAPTVLFLHGSGGKPEFLKGTLAEAAQASGLVVVAPRSSSDLGWGFNGDNQILVEALDATEAEGISDLDRLTVGGHSSGGAYAFLNTYGGGLPARAVFSLASPFYPVDPPLPVLPPPPIRMFYGEDDPNYQGGSHQRLANQWGRLGVPWQIEVAADHGHNSWPQASMNAGFEFLAFHAGAATSGAACVPGDTVLCLRDGRYRVEVDWQDFEGNVGPGQVVDGVTTAGDTSTVHSSGLFWFFNPSNWELMVKILDGCGSNGHVWVFSAATTNVAYTLRVTDTETGEEWRHDNAAGEPAPAVTDTTAFRCDIGG